MKITNDNIKGTGSKLFMIMYLGGLGNMGQDVYLDDCDQDLWYGDSEQHVLDQIIAEAVDEDDDDAANYIQIWNDELGSRIRIVEIGII